MKARLATMKRAAPAFVGAITMLLVLGLLAGDVLPAIVSRSVRDLLGTLSLTLIAIAYLMYEVIRRPSAAELVKAVLLAIAFLSWAASQFWPASRMAPLFNDIAIGLFVLDVFLVIVGWPSSSPDEAFAETFVQPQAQESE